MLRIATTVLTDDMHGLGRLFGQTAATIETPKNHRPITVQDFNIIQQLVTQALLDLFKLVVEPRVTQLQIGYCLQRRLLVALSNVLLQRFQHLVRMKPGQSTRKLHRLNSPARRLGQSNNAIYRIVCRSGIEAGRVCYLEELANHKLHDAMLRTAGYFMVFTARQSHFFIIAGPRQNHHRQ